MARPRTIAIKKTIALFEKKYPKIKVKPEFPDYAAFWEKFQTQASGGNPPDVFQNAVGFLRKYDKRGVLLDLRSQADAGNLSLDNFRDGVWRTVRSTASSSAFPSAPTPWRSSSTTRPSRRRASSRSRAGPGTSTSPRCKKIQDKTKIAGDTGYFGIMYLYDLYLRQNGKAFFTEDGLGFTEADLTQWWDGRLQARRRPGSSPTPRRSSRSSPSPVCRPGSPPSEFTWDNFTVRYTAEGESPTTASAPIPTTDGKETGQYLGSLMLSASARTKHPKEVAQFIDFMVHDPEVGKIMGYDRGILATTEQYDAFKPTDANNKGVAAYEDEVAKAGVLGKITPHPSGADVVEAAFLRIGGEIAQGKTKPADGAKAVLRRGRRPRSRAEGTHQP